MSVATLPLDGIRVLDLSRLLPGPYCSMLLADFGADVVKVEDTGAGDYMRWARPAYDGVDETAASALFVALNRGKRSIRVDLKHPEGRDVLLDLVRSADVVLESFRPGVLDRLGVGYEAMREVNPGIVVCAISGYGQDGPYRDRAGHDLNYQALIGLLAIGGERGGPPAHAAAQVADLGGGALMAAFGILAALRERDRSGEGQFVDVSMADGAMSWLAMFAARGFGSGQWPRRGDLELGGALVCYRAYECADGWVTLGALEPKFWASWCRGVGREDLLDRQFDAPGSPTHREVEAVFRARTRDEWTAFAAEHDCCLEPVLELEEAMASDLTAAREMVVELDQPGASQPVRALGVPVKLGRTPGDPHRRPAPALGEHTAELLRELGYDDERVRGLEQAGAVGGRAEGTHDAFMG
jgi:alpha-methylacyl-CoA racemase